MPNFSATQSFQTLGLCQTLRVTDTSPYGNNIENFTEANIEYKIFTVRNSSGTIIKQETSAGNVYSWDVGISLLTLNIVVDLSLKIKDNPNGSYGVSNALLVPCLGV